MAFLFLALTIIMIAYLALNDTVIIKEIKYNKNNNTYEWHARQVPRFEAIKLVNFNNNTTYATMAEIISYYNK